MCQSLAMKTRLLSPYGAPPHGTSQGASSAALHKRAHLQCHITHYHVSQYYPAPGPELHHWLSEKMGRQHRLCVNKSPVLSVPSLDAIGVLPRRRMATPELYRLPVTAVDVSLPALKAGMIHKDVVHTIQIPVKVPHLR